MEIGYESRSYLSGFSKEDKDSRLVDESMLPDPREKGLWSQISWVPVQTRHFVPRELLKTMILSFRNFKGKSPPLGRTI